MTENTQSDWANFDEVFWYDGGKLGGMFCVSLTLTSDEWMLILRSAGKQWPGETLSRSEIIRRYVLVAIEALKYATPDDLARLAHELQASMQAGDERLRT